MALTTVKTSALSGNINLTSQVTGALPTANGGTGATSFSPGKVLQVVSATLENSNQSTTSTSFQEFDCQVNITPSSTSSKILVMMNGGQNYTGTANEALQITIYRDSTNLGHSTYGMGRYHVSDKVLSSPHSFHFLDSPNSTSSLKYEGFFRSDSGSTVYAATSSMGKMSITCMEIGAWQI